MFTKIQDLTLKAPPPPGMYMEDDIFSQLYVAFSRHGDDENVYRFPHVDVEATARGGSGMRSLSRYTA